MKHHRRCFHGVESKKTVLNLRFYEIAKQISDQKLDLSLKISKLKEREETCKCVGWCGINHLKHSFKKSSSKELNCKFQKLINGSNLEEKPKMYSCKICEETVANVESLRKHMRQHVHCSNKAEACQ